MKKLLVTLGMGLLAWSTYAQGVVSMNTLGGGVNAPATIGSTTNRVSGTQFFAQLFWGLGDNAARDSLIAVTNPPATYGTGGGAGHVLTGGGGGNRVFAGLPQGTHVTLQIRGWDRALGADYGAAFQNWLTMPPGMILGESIRVNVVLTEPPTATATMLGLQPYSLNVVPEPSIIALGILGGLGVLLLRRRRN